MVLEAIALINRSYTNGGYLNGAAWLPVACLGQPKSKCNYEEIIKWEGNRGEAGEMDICEWGQ